MYFLTALAQLLLTLRGMLRAQVRAGGQAIEVVLFEPEDTGFWPWHHLSTSSSTEIRIVTCPDTLRGAPASDVCYGARHVG
ncbi:hypothetical protein EVAR_19397_1 [Eumeta japonica]|uniref:Secreted protein n=1 Tax=Eumeta variegata TaxID=151549 RepID=A0A4C1TRH6_EUMVA|nr:hypothetical protein EVAR_19397_1 [Eumeta japonica]